MLLSLSPCTSSVPRPALFGWCSDPMEGALLIYLGLNSSWAPEDIRMGGSQGGVSSGPEEAWLPGHL